MKVLNLIIILIFFSNPVLSQKFFMRYPDVSENNIVFSCNNDLWIVALNGGMARRLIKKTGLEIFPKFSPNGSKIVFTGIYENPGAIYLTDTTGTYIKRLTHYPSHNLPLEWIDNNTFFFRSNREYPFHTHDLYKMNIETEIPAMIPFDNVGQAGYSQLHSSLAYTRLAAEQDEYHERKRYEGGQAQDIWTGKLDGSKFTKITQFKGTDNFPMWRGNFIYFTSDRYRGILNLFKYDILNERISQLTFYEDFDVKYPSLGKNHIVFLLAENICLFDIKSEETDIVEIFIPEDSIQPRRDRINIPYYTESFGLSPDGRTALFGIRGEIIHYPLNKSMKFKNLTKTSGTREKDPVWSPDGEWVAFFSDRSGEEELYLKNLHHEALWKQITKGGKGFKRSPVFSPNSKRIIFSDKYMNLNLINLDSGEIIVIDQGKFDDSWFRWGIQDYCWSPDSRWIAYTKMEESMYESIFLYSVENNKSIRVTCSKYNDFSPSFSTDGRYLFFLSQRTFNPVMGRIDQEHIFLDMTRPYVLVLKNEEDPIYISGEPEKTPSVVDNLTGLGEDMEARIIELPVLAGNIFRLDAGKNGFFYMRRTENEFYKYQNVTDTDYSPVFDLYNYNLDKKENLLIKQNISQYHLSGNGRSIIYKSYPVFGVIETGNDTIRDNIINLNEIVIEIDRTKEYSQIFDEAWRIQRDWFYDKNMHGLDWQKIGEKYRRLIRYCSSREDLNYIIREMMAELNCGHTYVEGGDLENVRREYTGLLGVTFQYDKKAEFPKIKKIIPTDTWNPDIRSPLYIQDCPIKEGHYILAIDNTVISKGDNIYRILEEKGNKEIDITYNTVPDLQDARHYRVRALYSEMDLLYREWVKRNRDFVEQQTESQVGYIHLPYLERTGLAIFAENFYYQYNKKGLIIDLRYNRGGFASFMVLNRLRRELNSYKQPREGKFYPVPERVFDGKLVLLVNRYSGSAPEIFAEAWKNYNLGPIIGETTWGGAIGTETHQRLIDHGHVTAPQFARFNKNSELIIEGEGVSPDIEIINMPSDVLNGKDPQLETAVEVILKEIETSPEIKPIKPIYPDKNKQSTLKDSMEGNLLGSTKERNNNK